MHRAHAILLPTYCEFCRTEQHILRTMLREAKVAESGGKRVQNLYKYIQRLSKAYMADNCYSPSTVQYTEREARRNSDAQHSIQGDKKHLKKTICYKWAMPRHSSEGRDSKHWEHH